MSDESKPPLPHSTTDAKLSAPRKPDSSLSTLLLGGIVIALLAVLAAIVFAPFRNSGAETATVVTETVPKAESSPNKQSVGATDQASPLSTSTAPQLVPSTLPSQSLPSQSLPSQSLPPQSSVPAKTLEATASVRQSTIKLPKVELSLTVEQLHAESEHVARALQEQHPELPEALHVVALLTSQIRKSSEAEELWRQCIELDPGEVAYYVNLAAIAMDRGNSQLAADTLQKAIDKGLANEDVYHHLAVSLTNLGRSEEAEKVIHKALSTKENVAAFWTVLGQAQLKQGKFGAAEASLRTALQLGSQNTNLYLALGNALARQKKREEATKYLELFRDLKKNDNPLDKQQRFEILSTAEAQRTAVTVLCEAAVIYRQQKNPLESERLLMRAVALDPTSTAPCTLLAEHFKGANMLAEARVVQRRLIELQPLRPDNYLILAILSDQLNDPAEAEAALKMWLAIQPRATDAFVALAEFYFEQGKNQQARWYAQEALRREPNAAGYHFLAKACQALGEDAAAEAALAKALELERAGN